MNKPLFYSLLVIFSLSLSSCAPVGELLRTGFWFGFMIASAFWGLLWFLFRQLFNN